MQSSLLQLLILIRGMLIRIPLSVLTASLIARVLGPGGVGQWAMILSATALLDFLTLKWVQGPNIRFGREEWTSSHSLSNTWVARWPLIFFGVSFSTLLLILQPFSFLERFFNLPASWWPLILFFLLGQWWLSEVQSLLRITEKIGRFTMIPILIDIFSILFLISLFFQPPEARFTFALIGLVCINTVVSGVAWFIEFRSSKSLGGKINWSASKKMVLYGLPIVPGLYFNYLSNWGDHILLQYFKSTVDVGLFSASYQAMAALIGLAYSISMLLVPKLIDKKITDPEAERDYIIRIVPTILSFWLMMIIPMLIIIPWLFLIIFGSDFSDAIPSLLVLCGAVPCSIFTAVYAVLFQTQGRLGRSSFFGGVMFSVNIITSFVLVIEFGGVGVAVGTTLSYFIWQYFYVMDQHNFLEIPKAKIIIFLIFSIFYGLMQIAMGEEVAFRVGGAFLGFSCLILMIRHYKMVDRAILKNLLSGKLSSFHPHFDRLLIRN
jgi:O-antigen/teichoic acid export membrane protein